MSTGREELFDLVEALISGTITPGEHRRLEERLAADPTARQVYFDYLDLHLHLRQWQRTQAMPGETDGGEWAADQQSTINNQQSAIPPIIVDLSPAPHSPFLTLRSPVGSFLFSYTTAAVILGLALLVVWTWKISRDQQVVRDVPRRTIESTAPELQLVGRITGLADCQWATWTVDSGQWAVGSEAEIRNPKSEIPNPNLFVSLGAKFNVTSGLMEITYDTGAKVILQGPATYEVESARGGFLATGKLTARVDEKAESGGRRGEEAVGRSQWAVGSGQWAVGSEAEIRNPKSEISLPPSDQEAKGKRTANLPFSHKETGPITSLALRPSADASGQWPVASGQWEKIRNPKFQIPNPKSRNPQIPLFSVRTPTAIVTDLGTEFGVEVDKSGATRSHVFRGTVEMCPVRGGNFPRAIRLGADESAQVEVGNGPVVRVPPKMDRSSAATFVREMPGWAMVTRFNTGEGLKEGDPDPHWQVVARSDQPDFQPRSAVVTAVGPAFLANNPGRDQWISLGNGPPELPNGVTCTFRTTIELRGRGVPEHSMMNIWHLENRHVKAIRVNDKDIPTSTNPKDAGTVPPKTATPFQRGRLVEGINYVEFDVTNDDPSHPAGTSPILLRVMWH